MAAPSIDWRRVVGIWKQSGRTPATIALYACWARRFVAYCHARGRSPIDCLRRREVEQAVVRGRSRYGGQGCGGGRSAFSATRALSYALAALGYEVPVWEAPASREHLAPVLRDFVEYRLRHRGVSPSTARRDAALAALFTSFLRDKGDRVEGVRLVDVDEFIMRCAAKWTPKTVAGVCSTLRAFLRFAHASGRLRFDLASSVLAPRVRSVDRPRRVLPWNDVRRILRRIDVSHAPDGATSQQSS
jgi:integrase/recombinase XerD